MFEKSLKSQISLLLLCLFMVPLLASCGKTQAGGSTDIKGVTKYDFRISSGRAVLSVVFSEINLDGGVRIPLARPKDGFIEMGPNFGGGTLFVISTPLTSLLNNQGLPYLPLPDGRAIPGVYNGALQGLAVQLPVLGLTYLYMGEDVFGLFIPLELGSLPVVVTLRIRDEFGNILGILSGIPKGNTGKVSGVLFLFPVEGTSAAAQINQIL